MKLKDNKIYRLIMIPLCIAMCFFGRFIPLFPDLSKDATGVIFIFLGSLILWLTIGIDWPSLLCIFSLAFLENMSFNSVLSNSFGNSTFIFLLFTFACTYALSKTSFIKRIAIGFINLKLARKNGYWFTILFLSAVLFLGLFISPSVLFVVILPILDEIFKMAKIEKGDKIAKVLMMGLGFTVSISSGMTPIAHVFPVLAMNAANVSVAPLAYMGFAIPVGLITFALMIIVFFVFMRPDVAKLKDIDVSSLKNELGKVDKREIITLIVYGVVILLWVIPSFFKTAAPDFYKAINKYGTAMPPILGVLVLCIVRVDKKPLLTIEEGFKNVPWSSLIMCASTLVLGVALTSDAIGLKSFISTSLGASLQNLSPILILIFFALWAAVQTNVSSNMVTATLVSSVAATVILAASSTLELPVVASIIGMLASYAFATPPSMPHIAIVAGSDYCTTKDVLVYGAILMVISVVVSLLVGYPLGTLLV